MSDDNDNRPGCDYCGEYHLGTTHPRHDAMIRQEDIEKKLDEILEKMTKIETLTVKVIEEVKPTIDELMNSKLIAMLGVGKKK